MKSFLAICLLLVPLLVAADSPVSAEFKDPKAVRKMIGKLMDQPRRIKAEPVAVFYAEGVAHVDGFIPSNHFLSATNDPSKAHGRYTFQDGLLARREGVSETGKVKATELVWYNEKEAPILAVYVEAERDYMRYSYGEYDESGRIKAVYQFNHFFQLGFHTFFSYEGKALRAKVFNSDLELSSETLEERGRTYVIKDGKKELSNSIPREEVIRRPMKYGLKPFYPLVDFPFSPAEVDLQEPREVRKLFGMMMEQPRKPEKVAVFYGDGYSHVDRFIPTSHSLKETSDTAQVQHRFTFHDGQLALWESLSEGQLKASENIWYDDKGAPTLVVFADAGPDYRIYRYGVYDEKGRIKTIYRFNQYYQMDDYDTFTYERIFTRISNFAWDAKPRGATLYEKGNIYLIENGKKEFRATGDRRETGRHLMRYGLKPVYPSVD